MPFFPSGKGDITPTVVQMHRLCHRNGALFGSVDAPLMEPRLLEPKYPHRRHREIVVRHMVMRRCPTQTLCWA